MSIDRINNKAIHEGTDYTMHSLHAVDSILTSEIKHPNGTTGLTIDENGYMRMPNRPAFYAYGSNQVSVGISLFGQVGIPINQTNSYSSSNGLFTAPVSGVYHFSASHFGRVNASTNCWFWWHPWKNGAMYSGTFHSINPTPFSHETLTGSWVCRLEFGDTMGVYFNNSGGASDWGGDYSHFSGYLIG